jgi:hypothetical protein
VIKLWGGGSQRIIPIRPKLNKPIEDSPLQNLFDATSGEIDATSGPIEEDPSGAAGAKVSNIQ